MMTRRIPSHRSVWPVAVLALLTAISLLPATGHAADELIVADQKGQQRALLEASGAASTNLPYAIKWVDFEAAAPLLQALAAGAVDTGIAGDGPFIFAWGAGVPIKAAYIIPPRGGGKATAIVVAQDSPITTPAQLSGKRIATGRGSIGHLLLLRLLATGAIPPPAPQIVFLLPAQAKAALDTGRVDAWSTWEPYVSLEVVGHHGHIVVDAAGLMPNNSVFVASDAALAAKHAQIEDFYRRVTAAYEWGMTHQDQYARILAHQTGMPQDVANAVAEKLIAAPVPVSRDVIRAEQVTLDTYKQAGLVHPTTSFENAFDLNGDTP